MPAGRPPRIGTLVLAKIHTDQSICMSSTDSKTWPVDRRHNVIAEKGCNVSRGGILVRRLKPRVCCRIASVNAGASDNISNNIPAVTFNILITLQMVETDTPQH